ncbi:MAG: site-specific integrase [Daejeonella sp.]
MSTIRFELRKDLTSTKTGKAPLRIIYQMNGVRTFIPTDIKLSTINWDVENQAPVSISKKDAEKKYPDLNYEKTLSDSSQIKTVIEDMKDIENLIRNIERKFEAIGKPYSGSDILEEIKGVKAGLTRKDEPRDFLFNFMDQYISDHKYIREPGSLSVYKSVKEHLKAFEQHTRIKVRFETIDYRFFSNFQAFLISRTKANKAGIVSPMLNNTTIAKILSTLKTFLNYARQNGIKVPDAYKAFVIRKEKLEVIALDQEEFDALLNYDLSDNKRLDQVRDVFCFSCATGLRYSDISQLRKEHIQGDVITIIVKKTKSELTIPLNKISASIIKKYEDQNKLLPVISNQRLNEYVKELCKIAGINTPQEIVRFRGSTREVNVYPKWELIHFHTARKVFICLSLEKGMSISEVMEISGHMDFRSFSRYSRVTEKRKNLVMIKAWGEVSNLKVVS